MSWWFSLLFVIPMLGIGGTVLYTTVLHGGDIRGNVLDAYTGTPVAEARILADHLSMTSNDDGHFWFEPGVSRIVVEKAGYDSATMSLDSKQENVEIRLRPNVLQGRVISRDSDQPVSNASVEAHVDGEVIATARTDPAGEFQLGDLPEAFSVVVDSRDHARQVLDISRQAQLDVSLRPDVVTGKVVDSEGEPIEGATVAAGDGQAATAADGTFRLEGAPEAGPVVVKAPGYRAWVEPLSPSMTVNAQLESIRVRALYATAAATSSEELNELLDIIDRTEANALVVDLKDSSGSVFYDTEVQLAHEIGAVQPLFDPKDIVERLHQRGVYAIARIVVFEDPLLAEGRPEWAIHDSQTGGLWRTWNGLAWVNAHRQEVWEYNIALAVEAAQLGFDEIQLDYIRFPTDGPRHRAEYGVPHNEETRPEAVATFLRKAHDALAPTPAYLAGDVFGLTMWELGDGTIGQNLETVSEILDYVCPMIYPSHFAAGSMGLEIPNDHPYEVILWSLQNGAERIPARVPKLRPWLQDFSFGEGISYGDEEVRLQIQAADEAGTSGWMLWNAASEYHDGALAPAEN